MCPFTSVVERNILNIASGALNDAWLVLPSVIHGFLCPYVYIFLCALLFICDNIYIYLECSQFSAVSHIFLMTSMFIPLISIKLIKKN
jgi:hypothetical protein